MTPNGSWESRHRKASSEEIRLGGRSHPEFRHHQPYATTWPLHKAMKAEALSPSTDQMQDPRVYFQSRQALTLT